MQGYHYAAYETTALKRLMCRYASPESEIDELLRNHVFVDLYTVVCQALLIGEPSYSLKNVEHLFCRTVIARLLMLRIRSSTTTCASRKPRSD
jgi:predicted RecB family nuclease